MNSETLRGPRARLAVQEAGFARFNALPICSPVLAFYEIDRRRARIEPTARTLEEDRELKRRFPDRGGVGSRHLTLSALPLKSAAAG